MDGYVDSTGQTILWGIPTPPEGFRNITDHNQPGEYIFGHNRFTVRDMPITSLAQRKLAGGAEEFLLAFLSVVLIAVLSEIVQSILLRRRKNEKKVSQVGVEAAFLVDEFYHFRNIWSHAFGQKSEDHVERRKKTLTSIGILGIALLLMSADVFAVYLTQPNVVSSSFFDYNLRTSQPIGTSMRVAQLVYNMSLTRTCVTPGTTLSGQTRQFTLSACTMYDNAPERDVDGAIIEGDTDEIEVGSWFHEAGSDHEVVFGEHRIGIRQRGFLYLNGNGTRRIVFDSLETADFDITSYIHELFIHSAIQVNCNGKPPSSAPLQSCTELLQELRSSPPRRESRTKEIEFWRSRQGPVLQNVTGLVSTYRVQLDEAYTTVRNGLYPFTATAAIDERRGEGNYRNITSEELQTGALGLIVEEGRVAGLVTLGSIVGVMIIILALLRIFLRPLSLGVLATAAIRENGQREFVGAGDGKGGMFSEADSSYDYEFSEGQHNGGASFSDDHEIELGERRAPRNGNFETSAVQESGERAAHVSGSSLDNSFF